MKDYSLIYYKDIESRKIDWLWYPYIPFGKITIIQGDPGEGKTTFVLDLLSKLSTGRKLPFSNIRITGTSIYQNMEDDNCDTIKPRLEAHHADCSKIGFISKGSGFLSVDDADLECAVKQVQARVLVLDPIQSFIGESVDMNRANVIRPKLQRLKEIAETNHCAVLLVGHLNKNASGKANYRGLGSIDISAAARSILVIGRPKENLDIRVLAQLKNNLGPLGSSLAFSMSHGKIDWLEEYDVTAAELVSSSSNSSEMSKMRLAKILLTDKLQKEQLPYLKIIQFADELGLSKRTILRAKDELNIKSIRINGKWYWQFNK